MAIIIKGTDSKAIHIDGTAYDLPEVYGRLEFVGRSNGRSMEIAVATYVSKDMYEQGKLVFTDVPGGNINVNIQADEQQSIDVAHKYAKLAYEQAGYEVVIDLTLI